MSAVKNATANVLAIAGQETPGASTDDGAGIGCMLDNRTCNTGTWHFNGENVLHVDGHVKWLSWEQLVGESG